MTKSTQPSSYREVMKVGKEVETALSEALWRRTEMEKVKSKPRIGALLQPR